jgi:hypothetical protein
MKDVILLCTQISAGHIIFSKKQMTVKKNYVLEEISAIKNNQIININD